MKKLNENIEREIRETLASFDGMNKAVPKPFFYTRVVARREKLAMVTEQALEVSPVMIRITISALFVLFFISMYSVVTVQRKDSVITKTPAPTELESFIEDYYPQTPTVYNFDEKINQ